MAENDKGTTLVVPESRTSRRESNEVQLPAVRTDASAIMQVIANVARDPNADPDKMLKLYELRDRELARVAKQEFTEAMAEFKANPPKIIKDKHVEFQTSKGITAYDHATLGRVVAAVTDGLAKVGIQHRWDIDQGDQITVTCVLTHVGGHEVRVPMKAGADDSGGKNAIQARASTITYLQRYTLLAATGLAAGDDDDGRGANNYERITEQQAADLEALIQEVGANKLKLLEFLRLNELADIPASIFKDVVKQVEAKRKGAK